MPKIWIVSDTHFGHKKVALSRGFSSSDEMDEYILEKWNSKINPGDTVYHLGDVGFHKKERLFTIIEKLNGKKILLPGNHDNLKAEEYLEVFKDVRGVKIFDCGLILSHFPLEVGSVWPRYALNVHGHIHNQYQTIPHHLNVNWDILNGPISLTDIQNIYPIQLKGWKSLRRGE